LFWDQPGDAVVSRRSGSTASLRERDEEIRALLNGAEEVERGGAMKRRAFLSSRFADSLFLPTAFAVAIPTLALVSFAEPVADDFVRAAVVDVRQYVGWTYSHWSGRWAAIGLEALLFSKLPLLSIYSAVRDSKSFTS
jgi:hypothetical protein